MNNIEKKLISPTSLEITIRGALTFAHYRDFFFCYQNVESISTIVVNFEHTDYIECSGIGMLLLLKDYCDAHQITLTLINAVHGNEPSMFKLSRIDEYIGGETRKPVVA